VGFYLGGKRVFHFNAGAFSVNGDGTQLVVAPAKSAAIEHILHADVGDRSTYTFDVRVTANGFTSPVNAPADRFVYRGPTVSAVTPTQLAFSSTRPPVFTVTGSGFTGATSVGFYANRLLAAPRVFHIIPAHFTVSPDGTSITTSPQSMSAIRADIRAIFGKTPPPYDLQVAVSTGAITSAIPGAPTLTLTP
jgi:hypothetical protein